MGFDFDGRDGAKTSPRRASGATSCVSVLKTALQNKC